MKITTADAFLIIKIINKAKLKEDIITFVTDNKQIEVKKKNAYIKLKQAILEQHSDYDNLGQEEKLAINEEMLEERKDIQQEIENVENERQQMTLDLLFTVLGKIELVEEEFYKLIAKLKGIEVDEAKELNVMDMLRIVTNAMSNESLQKLFS